MPTINQLVRKPRVRKTHYRMCPALEKHPLKRGVCVKVGIMKPKKPNSAIRKIAHVKLSNNRKVLVYIPGQGHNLQQHSVVLVRGGRVKDLPGIHYHMIRGKYDFVATEKFLRENRRSKYGIKKPLKKDEK